MSYQLEYSEKARKQLQKLDKHDSKRIIDWLEDNILGCSNPRTHGKSLTGNMRELWRYRVGNYRVLAEIHDNELIVIAVKIDHRKQVYKR